MHRYDHPTQIQNPYPAANMRISDFRYDSALVLLRLKDAIRLRTGEDADFIVARPFVVSWRTADGEWVQIVVPEGLITDLTSVPRLWRWIVGRVGPWLEAAIVHDYLYIAWQDIPDRGARAADRRFADDIMLIAMRAAKVNPIRAYLIYLAVRWFGAGGFRTPDAERYLDLDDPEVTEQLAFRLPRAN